MMSSCNRFECGISCLKFIGGCCVHQTNQPTGGYQPHPPICRAEPPNDPIGPIKYQDTSSAGAPGPTSLVDCHTGTMSGLRSSVDLLRVAVRSQLVSRAALSHKPAKHDISAAEQGFALAVMFVTILGPSGWVLMHLESYKHRP
ncbi:hypothetical protein DPEC_G00161430 [Dallia pectoralis]|uniref:Uncharacterized protein n=1 Tax=Dallia pectoralis TaxID=75939 RepID=A0ACC2GG21_DALPE|nr:hypothetical protein DPEC_G00161430 [Dallia pectoralis]